jgi:hypothetical protein
VYLSLFFLVYRYCFPVPRACVCVGGPRTTPDATSASNRRVACLVGFVDAYVEAVSTRSSFFFALAASVRAQWSSSREHNTRNQKKKPLKNQKMRFLCPSAVRECARNGVLWRKLDGTSRFWKCRRKGGQSITGAERAAFPPLHSSVFTHKE